MGSSLGPGVAWPSGTGQEDTEHRDRERPVSQEKSCFVDSGCGSFRGNLRPISVANTSGKGQM